MNEVISGVLWLGCSLSAVLQGSKEVSVKEQQGVQAREDLGHAVPVELQLLQHASPEHLGHDRQGLDVVQLCLHQLCMGIVIVGMFIGADGWILLANSYMHEASWNFQGHRIPSVTSFNKFLRKGIFV